jgi:DNA-binding NarL/FixJ family response regulator
MKSAQLSMKRCQRHKKRPAVDQAAVYGRVMLGETSLLTTRQREIFDLIVLGTSNKEIARKLGLSEGTVKIHIAKLFGKLGVRRRGAVALAGANLGLRPSFMMTAALAAAE